MGALAVVAGLVGGAGCGKITEKIAAKAVEKTIEVQTGGKVDIDAKGGSVKFKDEKTGAVAEWGASAKLPGDWPSDVPVYPGAKILAAMTANGGRSLTLQSPDAPDKIAEYYKSKLGTFKKESELDMGAAKMVAFTSGKRTVGVTVTGSNDETSILLTVATRQ